MTAPNPFAKAAGNTAAPAANPAPAAAPAAQSPAQNFATASGDAAKPESVAPAGNLTDLFNTNVSSGDQHRISDDKGAALLVRPREFKTAVKTVHGESDGILADWIVLTGPAQGEVRADGLIFNAVVRSTLKNVLEGPQPFFVGFLTEGQPQPGKSAPLIFETATDEHLQLAQQAGQAHGWF